MPDTLDSSRERDIHNDDHHVKEVDVLDTVALDENHYSHHWLSEASLFARGCVRKSRACNVGRRPKNRKECSHSCPCHPPTQPQPPLTAVIVWEMAGAGGPSCVMCRRHAKPRSHAGQDGNTSSWTCVFTCQINGFFSTVRKSVTLIHRWLYCSLPSCSLKAREPQLSLEWMERSGWRIFPSHLSGSREQWRVSKWADWTGCKAGSDRRLWGSVHLPKFSY